MYATIEKIKDYSTDRLVDIVKNYKQYGYSDELRNDVLMLLEERGIDKETLILQGNFSNDTYETSDNYYHLFQKYSTIAFIFHILSFLLQMISVFDRDNSEAELLLVLSIAFGIMFLIFLILSLMAQNNFYKTINKSISPADLLIYFIVGLPFYFIAYFFYKNKMKEDLNNLR